MDMDKTLPNVNYWDGIYMMCEQVMSCCEPVDWVLNCPAGDVMDISPDEGQYYGGHFKIQKWLYMPRLRCQKRLCNRKGREPTQFPCTTEIAVAPTAR